MQAERTRRIRTSTLSDANSYFLIHYAFLWLAIILSVRGLRLALDFLDSIYPYDVKPQVDAFSFLRGWEAYAVSIAWVAKLPAVLPCWKDRQVRICYQPCVIMDALVTLNYTLQVLLIHELPEFSSGWLSADTRALAFATAGILLWQEAGSAVMLMGRPRLAVFYSVGVVVSLALGAWGVLCSDSILDPLFSLTLGLCSMAVTYVSFPPLITKTY